MSGPQDHLASTAAAVVVVSRFLALALLAAQLAPVAVVMVHYGGACDLAVPVGRQPFVMIMGTPARA